MVCTPPRSRSRSGVLAALAGLAAVVVTTGLGLLLVVELVAPPPSGSPCPPAGGASGLVVLGSTAGGARVGASEYGGPGDPGSGVIGALGANLLEHPDSYAELGGPTFASASAMGALPYLTPLRVSWDGRSAVAYKRDFGLGGGPVAGLPRVIDLWWGFARALRIPYEDGRWSGAVRINRVPAGGAGGLLGASGVAAPAQTGCSADSAPGGDVDVGGVSLTDGSRARLLPGGLAAAPASAPAAVRGVIAAGNQIVGKPYVYGAAHGVPLDELAAAYDCSSSVEHLLYGGGLVPVGYGGPSGALESFGQPGPGRWITIYASADHVFMYVAGLRWDTHNAAGPQDGTAGIGWHPLVRSAAGFVARHPEGL